MISKTFALALGFSALVLAVVPATAQTAKDKAIESLTNSRDMSTGLPMNAPAQQKGGVVGGTANDKAVEKLTNSKDMSTGLPMNAPAQAKGGVAGGTANDKAIEKLTNERDMSTGLQK